MDDVVTVTISARKIQNRVLRTAFLVSVISGMGTYFFGKKLYFKTLDVIDAAIKEAM